MIFSKNEKTTGGNNRLCKSDGSSGSERCKTPSNTDVSSFYAIIYAHREHTKGSLTFTGSKLISVTNVNHTKETEPVLRQRCEQIGLAQKIENITGAIDQTHQETEGKMTLQSIPIWILWENTLHVCCT